MQKKLCEIMRILLSIRRGKMKKMPCEIYSRVVGYMRPLNQWNPGKRSEFADRKTYKINKEASK